MSARECPGCGLTVRTPDDADRDDDARLCPDGRCHGTDALSRVRASRAGGYSTLDLDPRDVDAVLSALDAGEVAAGHQRTRADAAEAECARLRAAMGRTVPPTDAEWAAIVEHDCTGLSARWCPACGDCTCGPRYEGGGGDGAAGARTLDDAGCPLHGASSPHAGAPFDGVEDLASLRAEVIAAHEERDALTLRCDALAAMRRETMEALDIDPAGDAPHAIRTLISERDAAQHTADALRTALDGLRAAVLREREAMERDTLRGLTDAMRADNVRLRAIVESVRSARAVSAAAAERYTAAWDAVGTMPPTPAQSEEIAAALLAAYEAGDALTAALDVAAAPDARDNLRRVRAMYDAAPPEGCDDGDRTPALERVVASLAGGYSTSDLDARDVRCLVVAFDDAEQIINALQGQAALLRGEVNELRAKVADLTGDYETRCDETRRLGDELLAGLAGLAGEIVDALARAAAAEAECARLTTERDAARRAATFAEMERDTLRGLTDAMRADNVRLRAIVEGREHPPTPDEAEAHYRAGGGWLYARAEGCRASVAAVPMTVRSIACAADYQRETLRWWPLDASGRPCPWPTALDAGEGR